MSGKSPDDWAKVQQELEELRAYKKADEGQKLQKAEEDKKLLASGKRTIKMTINGEEYEGRAEPRTLLVHFIRDELNLTGTHIGCDTGHCGACTIFIDGVTYKSCMWLAWQAEGRKLLTVEGLAQDGKLHPIQEAFTENHGLQCGYCTPGMLLAGLYLLKRNADPNEEEIRRGIEGNLCRCTGYVNIVKALFAAADKLKKQGMWKLPHIE